MIIILELFFKINETRRTSSNAKSLDRTKKVKRNHDERFKNALIKKMNEKAQAVSGL